ncbi:MAG TPA: D-aminoacylase [Candidatus Moranbacteria bacterium]|nr:D-aminoacylase [Candidatus Moranbacteria bacterium]
MYDIIIKNGQIIDGTGAPMFLGDIGIKEEKIAKIGDLRNEKADEIIDAGGKYVCPGFIDVNNHSDTYWQLFLNPDLESLVYQGITTIVGGNCGSSLAPLTSSKNIESIQKWADLKKINVNWLKFKEFTGFMENKRFSVNFATLVGHGTMRRGILHDEVRNLVPKELNFMKKELANSLGSGAFGMSTGLVYTHAKLAPIEELTELAKIVKKYDGVYATHIRGEDEELVGSCEEAVEIARRSGAKLHISHLKAMGRKNWGKMDEALDIIDHAYENGIDVTFDIYPYINTGSVLYTLLPDWVAEGGKKIMIHRLKDPVVRAKVIAEIKKSSFDYSKVEIAISPLNKTLARRKILEIAISQEKSVEDAIIDILIASEGRVITSMEILSKDNVKKAIMHPLSIISTNGAGYSIDHRSSGELVHQRSFGTFIKVLSEYVAGEKLLSFEEAIKKMTSLPAKKFGLEKRGELKEKNFADIIILDKNKLDSPATKDNPYQYCRGVEYLLVGGKIVLSAGKYLGIRNGEMITR